MQRIISAVWRGGQLRLVVVAVYAKCCIDESCAGDSEATTRVFGAAGLALNVVVVHSLVRRDIGHCLLPLRRWALAVRFAGWDGAMFGGLQAVAHGHRRWLATD